MLKQLVQEATDMECNAGGFAASEAIKSLTKTWESQDVNIVDMFDDFDILMAELISLRLRMHKTKNDGNKISTLDGPAMELGGVQEILRNIRSTHSSMERSGSCKRCASPLRVDGYCKSEVCPHSDWPQAADINKLNEVNADQYQNESGLFKRISIDAEAHSDEREVEQEFDASPYFHFALESGNLNQILQTLNVCDFANAESADSVAEFFSGDETKSVFDYMNIKSGFECSIEKETVLKWLETFAPESCKYID